MKLYFINFIKKLIFTLILWEFYLIINPTLVLLIISIKKNYSKYFKIIIFLIFTIFLHYVFICFF